MKTLIQKHLYDIACPAILTMHTVLNLAMVRLKKRITPFPAITYQLILQCLKNMRHYTLM